MILPVVDSVAIATTTAFLVTTSVGILSALSATKKDLLCIYMDKLFFYGNKYIMFLKQDECVKLAQCGHSLDD